MDDNSFKKINKPASCTRPPWAGLIDSNSRENTLREIRRETMAAYGQSMDECPKRKVCFGKQCLGRPLPVKSATAKPYIEELKKTHKIVNDELFIPLCGPCPLAKTCKSACAELNDFLQRDKSEEPQIQYRDNLENIAPEPDSPVAPIDNLIGKGLKVAWDVLNVKRKRTVEAYVHEQKDLLTVAIELGYHDQARAKYELYAALTTLSEYSNMRHFIKYNQDKLTIYQFLVLNEIYNLNKSLTIVAKELKVSKQAIQQTVKRVIEKNNIKWTIFVKKQNNKVIYYAPEVLK